MSGKPTGASSGQADKKGQKETSKNEQQQEQSSSGGSELTCDSLSSCTVVSGLIEQYNTLVQSINATAFGVYENSMHTSRVVATKLREFGNTMMGIEKEPFSKEHYDAIVKMKKEKPKLYKELVEFAGNMSKLPFEMKGEQTLEFVNHLIKIGLLGERKGNQ